MKTTPHGLSAALLLSFSAGLVGCASTPKTENAPKLAPIAPLEARGTAPMTNESGLVLWSAGADALLADPRDAGLRRAFGTLDDRLLDLADPDPSARSAISLVLSALAGPISLRVDATQNGMPPVRGQVELGARDAAHAATLEREIATLLTQAGVEGMQTPMGPLEHAVADDRVVLSIGGMQTEELGLGSLDLPAGVDPTLALKLDLSKFWPMVQMMLAGEPEAAPMLAMLEGTGMVGDDAMAMTFAFGAKDGVGHMALRMTDYVPATERMGALERAPITAAELGLIPTDAVSAAINQSDPSAALGMLELMREPMGGDPMEMIHQMTGVHLKRDVFDHIGTTAGWYTSDSTGGGGMMSFVMFVEVLNEDDLRATIDYGLKTLNDVAAMEADGQVEVRDWMHGEALCSTLTFPGMPIPIELSFSIDDGFLFFTMSPQALTAALDQRASRGLGLAANPRFRAAARGSLDDVISLAYTDTARRAQDGYGLATMLCAALANGVRSPEDMAMDPGIVLPPYSQLAGASQASVLLGRLEGDDLVQIGTCDPSFAANMTALCGSPLVFVIGVGIGASAAIPAMMVMGMSGGQPVPFQYEVEDSAWESGDWQSEGLTDEEIEMLRALGYTEDEAEGMLDDIEAQIEEMPEEIIEEVVEEPILEDVTDDADGDDPR